MGCSGSKSTAVSGGGGGGAGGPTLYYMVTSPPSRAVLMCARAISLKLTLQTVNMFTGEHKAEWYLKINPAGQVPALTDGSLTLPESRPILQYLVNQYAPGNDIYPSDPKRRAVIERFLYYDFSTFAPAAIAFFGPQLRTGAAAEPDKQAALEKCFDYLDQELTTKKYVASDALSIVDFSIASMTAFLEAIDFDYSKFKNVTSYMARMRELPYYADCINEGNEMTKQYVQSVREKAASN